MVGYKERQERAIFEAIYRVEDYDSVCHQDSPDFSVALRGNSDETFGVEVTELFQSESVARLNIVAPYLDELFAGGEFRHKEDSVNLKVAKIELRDADGNVKQTDIPAVILELPPASSHSERIAERIREKSNKIASYLASVSYVNLIIMDWMDSYSQIDDYYSVSRLLDHGLRSAVIESDFREIYLISGKTQTYRPLRVLTLWELFYTYCRAMVAFEDVEKVANDDVVPLFLAMMTERGIRNLYLFGSGRDTLKAYWNGVAVGLGRDGGVDFTDYNDFAPPDATAMPVLVTDHKVVDSFRRFYDEYMAIGWEFSAKMMLPLRSEVPRYGEAQRFVARPIDEPGRLSLDQARDT